MAARDKDAKIEELLETVFFLRSFARLYIGEQLREGGRCEMTASLEISCETVAGH
jgi:hypothetical protein